MEKRRHVPYGWSHEEIRPDFLKLRRRVAFRVLRDVCDKPKLHEFGPLRKAADVNACISKNLDEGLRVHSRLIILLVCSPFRLLTVGT